MTYERSQVSTFSSQVSTDYLTILAGFPNVVEASVFGTLMAFEWKVWVGLICSLFLCILTNFLVDVVIGYPQKATAKTLEAHWWTYFSAIFCESSPMPPVLNSGRIVFAVWWLTIIVLMNSFTGHMKATMMVRPEPVRIESMKDLSLRPHMRTLIWKGSAYEALFKNSDVDVYQAIWKMVAKSNGTCETSVLFSEENLRSVQLGKAVVVGDVTTTSFHMSRTCRTLRDGTYYLAKEEFFPHKFAVAVQKNSDPYFLSFMNERINWCLESGLIQAWKQAYGDWEACVAGFNDDVYKPLSMFEVQSVFYIYLMFTAVAVAVFIGELVIPGGRRKKRVEVLRIKVATLSSTGASRQKGAPEFQIARTKPKVLRR